MTPRSCETDARHCDNTPSHPHPVGGKASQTVSSGSPVGAYSPGRKPRGAHTHGVDRGKAPRATNTSCVTGILLARVEGLEATLPPRPLILSTPLPSPSSPQETPPQTPSEDPQEPFPQGPSGQSQRRTVEASDTALSWGGGRVLRDALAGPQCRASGVMLVIIPRRVYTKLGP